MPVRPGPIEHASFVSALQLDGRMYHVQGIELDGDHLFVTSVDRRKHRGYLHEFDRTTGKLQRQIELTDGLRYHPGGLSIHGSSIWVPVAELRRNSTAVLEEIDTATLQVRRRIYVADHLGCVAASGSNLIAGNWDSRLLYIFDLDNRDQMRVVPNPSLARYQDMKLVGDQLVAGGSRSKRSGTIDWIDWRTMKLTRTLHAGSTDRVGTSRRTSLYTREGMAIDGRDLYFVPEDGPSRLFRFRLDS